MSNRKKRPPSPDRAAEDLAAAAAYLSHAGRRLLDMDSEALASLPLRLLQTQGAQLLRVGRAIQQFLDERAAGRDASLEHSIGLVARQGNPGGRSIWAERADLQKRKGWSAKKIADHYGLLDMTNVRDGLKRGHQENEERFKTETAPAEIEARLDRVAEKRQEARRQRVLAGESRESWPRRRSPPRQR